MKKIRFAALTALAIGLGLTVTFVQAENKKEARIPVTSPANGNQTFYYDEGLQTWFDSPTGSNAGRLGRDLNKALSALQSSDDDADRQAAKEILHAILGKMFDQDMERRESQLKEIRDQLTKMESKITKRAEKRDQIIQLRAEVLVNEQNGLGWGTTRAPSPQLQWDPFAPQPVTGPRFMNPGAWDPRIAVPGNPRSEADRSADARRGLPLEGSDGSETSEPFDLRRRIEENSEELRRGVRARQKTEEMSRIERARRNAEAMWRQDPEWLAK